MALRRQIAALVGGIALIGIAAAVAVQLATGPAPARGLPPRDNPVAAPAPPSPPPAAVPRPRAQAAAPLPSSTPALPAPTPPPAPEPTGLAPPPPPGDALAVRLGTAGAADVRRTAARFTDLCWQPAASRLASGEAPEFELVLRFDPAGRELLREVRAVLRSSVEDPTRPAVGSLATQEARQAIQACAATVKDVPPLSVPPPGESVEVTVPLGGP